jgi:hypothetical protein
MTKEWPGGAKKLARIIRQIMSYSFIKIVVSAICIGIDRKMPALL